MNTEEACAPSSDSRFGPDSTYEPPQQFQKPFRSDLDNSFYNEAQSNQHFQPQDAYPLYSGSYQDDRSITYQPPWAYDNSFHSISQDSYNRFSILSLIIAFIFAPVGLVLGAVSLTQISKTGEKGWGIAMVGTIISGLFSGVWLLMMIGYLMVDYVFSIS